MLTIILACLGRKALTHVTVDAQSGKRAPRPVQ